MEHLPKDLWVQIFLKLPVKTILRCLSVCKTWQNFIQDPSFISSHLQNQRHDLMFVQSITDDIKNKHNTFNYNDKEETTLAKRVEPECYSLICDDEFFSLYAKHEFPILYHYGHYRIVGSCNGIICVTDDVDGTRHGTYLWNPTIKKCIELPTPMFTFDKVGGFEQELGFGFDKKTNDYKLVRLVLPVDEYKSPIEVEIYSLSSGIWRKASHLASDLFGIRICWRSRTARNYQVYLNGILHWVGEDRNREGSRCMIIAFHLGDEVFRCFEPPLEIKNRDPYWAEKLRPLVFQGSLSLIHCSGLTPLWMHSREQKCYIWMMKDYGDSTSWAKYLDVNLSNKVSRVIGLRNNGELLIEIEKGLYSYKPTEGRPLMYLDERELGVWKLLQEGHAEEIHYVSQDVRDYDPKDAPKELGIRSKRNDTIRYSFHSEIYTESLVLLGRTNCAEVAKLQEKDSERTNEEDKKHVADLMDYFEEAG